MLLDFCENKNPISYQLIIVLSNFSIQSRIGVVFHFQHSISKIKSQNKVVFKLGCIQLEAKLHYLHASVHRRILSLIHLEYYHTYSIASTARTVAPDGYRHGRWTPKGTEPSQDHSSSEIPEEPAGIVEPALQRNHVATDVLVLLADTVTYHLRGVRKPRHRHWPTRAPPNKDRVNDGLVPHQPTPTGR